MLLPSGFSPAQREPNSPVFKNYKPPQELPHIAQSDPIYEIWQAFLVARKANAGDVLAQHELGIRYLTGRGVEADTVKAAYWIEKAAEQNLLLARFNLGILSYHGWGLPWNPFRSYTEFLYCAEHDMPDAQFVVGELLTENLVVPWDLDKAYFWVKKAAAAGYKPAREVLRELERRVHVAGRDSTSSDSTTQGKSSPEGNSAASYFFDVQEDSTSPGSEWRVLKHVLQEARPEVRRALGLSRHLEGDPEVDSVSLRVIEQAADAGSPEALTLLGRCYDRGIEVEKDPIKAAAMYSRAIRMDSPRAPELLRVLLQKREFFPELKLRSEKGDPDAQFAWASLLALGFSQPLSAGQALITGAQALQLLKKAIASHHVQAMIEMGLCYYAGRWVARDESYAVKLWRQASDQGSREARLRLAVTAVRGNEEVMESRDAVIVLRRGVEEGSVLAEVALGYSFETGTGVERNPTEAVSLYRDGAHRGSQDAYRALRRLHDEIRPGGVEFRITD